MRKRVLPALRIALIPISLAICPSCQRPHRDFSYTGKTMGTTWTLRTLGMPTEPGDLQRKLDDLEAIFSTWNADSEVSRFNRHPTNIPFLASRPLREAVAIAKDVHRRSGGAFDPTVGPLVAAFGFGPPAAADPTAAPCFPSIALNPTDGSLSKSRENASLDLSAMVEGYALDRVSEALCSQGHENFLLEIGGEFLAWGGGPSGDGWKIGVQNPSAPPGEEITVVTLHNEAMATSGTYVQRTRDDTARITHIIDPQTRQPVSHATVSVTVIAKRAVWADAWATALLVLGPNKGRDIADREGIEALFLTADRRGQEAKASSGVPLTTPVPPSSGRSEAGTRSK